MNYAWEPRWLIEGMERFHLTNPTTRFQWWYFDAALDDGSLLVVALVPQGWWVSEFAPNVEHCTLFVSLRSPSGTLTKRTSSRPTSELVLSNGRLSVGDVFTLEKTAGEYLVFAKLDGITLTLRVRASAHPFAASPFGKLPHWILRALSFKRPPISYASLVPRESAHVKVVTAANVFEGNGIAYHEQGRFDGASHDLPRDGWIWFHIFGREWGVFGAEDAYIHVIGPSALSQRGFPMRSETFTLTNKQYWHRDERVLKAMTLDFKIPDISLTALFESPEEENLIHYSASNQRELWSTRYAKAHVQIRHDGQAHDFTAPALLETCRCK